MAEKHSRTEVDLTKETCFGCYAVEFIFVVVGGGFPLHRNPKLPKLANAVRVAVHFRSHRHWLVSPDRGRAKNCDFEAAW